MQAAIGLGSNLSSRFGTPRKNLLEALSRLEGLSTVIAVSSFYATEPVGYLDQPRFTNAAARIDTNLLPVQLMRGLLAIEHSMGRLRSADQPPKGPRLIDLDLLLYKGCSDDDLIQSDPDLVLPHPELHHRAFVLQPLAEVASEWAHPVLHKSVGQLWAEFQMPPAQL